MKSNDDEPMTRLVRAHAEAALELQEAPSSRQRLPFFALVGGKPCAIAITFHADRSFEIVISSF